MPSELPLISKADYINYTSEWKRFRTDEYLNNYFQKVENNKLMPVYGVLFPVAAIKALLSSEGLTKLKARFCVKEEKFNIILFGSDEEGMINSAYYIGELCTQLPQGNGTGGNVTPWLADDWIQNWKQYITTSGKGITPLSLFATRYDILNGYTYDMQDFMHAMYDGVLVDMNSEYLYVHYALHQHYHEDATKTDNPIYTFNTVLQRVKVDSNGIMPVDNNPYYDISAPCPPLC